MKVVAYTRVSTREQADTGHGIDAQRTELRRQAELRGWEIVAWCEDLGVSGANMKRDQLTRGVKLVESGEADALVATKIDRVSRSVADFAALVCRANTRGWRWSFSTSAWTSRLRWGSSPRTLCAPPQCWSET